MKQKIILSLFILAITFFSLKSSTSEKTEIKNTPSNPKEELSEAKKLYQDIDLKGKLNYNVFELALNGFNNMKYYFKNTDIITVIDFSLPSTAKRMYVIDLKNKKLLFETIVSHGKNSGDIFATDFSNNLNSHQSSLGFYVTENTYIGRNGYSLVIDGLEKNINSNAKKRAVVIHGADYCNESIIRNTGRLGRSYGCPALPRELNKPIINTIKDGSMLFIYADDKEYLASSKMLAKKDNSMLAQKEDENSAFSKNELMK